MDEKLKQRLVGSAVVISLGVIFLPMILDGGRYTDLEKVQVDIPQRPDIGVPLAIEPFDAPLERLPEITDTGEGAGANEDKRQTPVIEAESAEPAAPVQAAEQAPAATVVQKDTDDASEPPAAKMLSPPLFSGSALIKAWVVQIGSFSSRENAIELRNKLRKQGFAAFVESFDANGAAAHRVRIGPEATHSRSKKTLAALKQKMQLDGIIVSYP